MDACRVPTARTSLMNTLSSHFAVLWHDCMAGYSYQMPTALPAKDGLNQYENGVLIISDAYSFILLRLSPFLLRDLFFILARIQLYSHGDTILSPWRYNSIPMEIQFYSHGNKKEIREKKTKTRDIVT